MIDANFDDSGATNAGSQHAAISALAQRYYDEEGQPEGKAEEHWLRAEREIQGGGGAISFPGSLDAISHEQDASLK